MRVPSISSVSPSMMLAWPVKSSAAAACAEISAKAPTIAQSFIGPRSNTGTPIWRHALVPIEAAILLGRPCFLITPFLKIGFAALGTWADTRTKPLRARSGRPRNLWRVHIGARRADRPGKTRNATAGTISVSPVGRRATVGLLLFHRAKAYRRRICRIREPRCQTHVDKSAAVVPAP
jgi:hypothetical protein